MMPCAILAGGLGTRLGDLTRTCPKPLVEVAGQPFIWHQLALLHAAGVNQVFVLVSHMAEQFTEELAEASVSNFRVEVLLDNPPLAGTAAALRPLADRLDVPFFVLYGDSFLPCDYKLIEDRFRKRQAMAMMVVCHTPVGATSNACFWHGQVVAYSKRDRGPGMHHIDYGLNILTPEALRQVPFPRDLSDVQAELARQGFLAGFEWPERYYTIGTPSGLAETEAVIRSRMTQHSK